MTMIVQAIKEEHLNIARLLDVLERQIDAFSHDRGPDYEIIDGALEYFLNYPEKCHHPKEDLIFARLRERAPEAVAHFGDLEAEHKKISLVTERLASAVGNIHLDAEMPRGMVENLAREFLTAYRHHIEMEETVFFPAALAALTDSDWDALNTAAGDLEDPLFGARVADSYRSLHREIMALAKT